MDFVETFWMMYDRDMKGRNEFYLKILKRYNYANKKYRHMRRSGENTEMGRTYIKYGPPMEVSRNPSEFSSQDFQEVIVWQYDKPRYFQVVFADYTGTGDFVVLEEHSNSPTVMGPDYRYRTLEEVKEWRNEYEKN